jgi:hypothetical protein
MSPDSKPLTLELKRESLPFDPKHLNPKDPTIFAGTEICGRGNLEGVEP